MRRSWDRTRVMTVLAAIRDAGIAVPAMSRKSGVTRSTIYRWMSGDVQPDYGKVYSLAYAVWPRYPGLARDLVEASGYAWAEPTDAPEPDVLADEFGEDTAARLRRVLGKRGETGAAVLQAIEDEFRSPGESPGESRQERAAGEQSERTRAAG